MNAGHRREFALLAMQTSMLTLTLHAVLDKFYHEPTVEKTFDEYDTNRQRQSAHAFSSSQRPRLFFNTVSSFSPGNQVNPFFFLSDDEEDDEIFRNFFVDRSSRTESQFCVPRFHPFVDRNPREKISSPSPPPFEFARSRGGYSEYAAMSSTSKKRRAVFIEILLKIWKQSGLPASNSNAVYENRDKKNRINRKIFKETFDGIVVLSGNYNRLKTVCKHEDVDYLIKYQNLIDEEVRVLIIPFLIIASGDINNENVSISVQIQIIFNNNGRARSNIYQKKGACFFNTAEGKIYIGEDFYT